MCLHVECMFIRGAKQCKKKLKRAREMAGMEQQSKSKCGDGDKTPVGLFQKISLVWLFENGCGKSISENKLLRNDNPIFQ